MASYPSAGAPIGHNLDSNMVPFFPPITNRDMFVTSAELGYVYDVTFDGEEAFVAESSGFEEIDVVDEPPSFLLSILAVAVFVLVICLLILTIATCRKRRRASKRDLYEQLVSEEDVE